MEKEKPLLILKPSIINALVPSIAKTLFYILVLSIVLYGFFWVIEEFNVLNKDLFGIYLWLIFGLTILLSIPIVIKLIILNNSQYFFYKTHVVSEFELFFVRRHSTPYHQIVNITSQVSLWDRLCKAGDVTLHTAEDRLPDLVLHYIQEPNKIESTLYEMIHQYKTTQQHQAESPLNKINSEL